VRVNGDPGHQRTTPLSVSKMLLFLGLGADAGTIYQVMVRHADANLIEVALILAWPDERVRDALAELEGFSLIRPSWEEPGEIRLVGPEVGLGPLLAKREAGLLRYGQDVADSRAAAAAVIADFGEDRDAHRSPLGENLIGLDAIYLAIEELAKSCTSEVMLFASDGPQTQVNMATSRPLDQALLERGVRVRILYLGSIINDPATAAYASWLKGAGGEVRIVPSLPARMAIYDRRMAMVAIDPDRSGSGAILLQGAGLLSVLCASFDQVWETAAQWGAPRHTDAAGPSAQEREILRLLADGSTDEVVARRLAISVRTTRRLIADVAITLGARSRFQVGVRAAEAGWLQAPRLG
jgi:DNA-binding CsgD family transcriptional regulator